MYMIKILNLNYTWIEHFQIPTKTKYPYQPLLPLPYPPPPREVALTEINKLNIYYRQQVPVS